MKGFKDTTKTQYATGSGGVKGAAKVAQVTGDFKRGCAKPVKKAMGGPVVETSAQRPLSAKEHATMSPPQGGLQQAAQASRIKQALQQRMQQAMQARRQGVPVANRQPLIRRP